MTAMKVPGLRVVFEEADRRAILQEIDAVLQSGMVAQDKKVREFEEFWAAYTGCRHAIACASGGAALEILTRALGVEGKDVLVPTNTFVATPNAVQLAGGRPVFLDLDPRTMGVTLEEIQRKCTDRTAGVIVVHIGGIISDEMERIAAWCAQRGIWLLEDAAHAHGSEFAGKRAGRFGVAAAYSFFATKVVTSGEGGMIVCDDDGLRDACLQLRDYGKRTQWETYHVRIAGNHRMSDLTAVVGISQSRRLDEFIAHRETIAARYNRHLNGKVDLILPPARSSWYKYITLVPPGGDRDAVRADMKARGVSIPGGVYDLPVHLQPAYESLGLRGALPLAEDICARHLCLPMFFGMTAEQADYVAETLLDVLAQRASAPSAAQAR